MQLTLINRRAVPSRVILVLGFLLAVYLVLSVPATSVGSDRQGELSQIEAASSLAELKAHASGLAMVAKNATQISAVPCGIVILTPLLFIGLSILNLVWLRRLKRFNDETHTT